MNMIWHAINNHHLLILITDYSCNVFVKFTFPAIGYGIPSSLNGKNYMEIYLGIGICHIVEPRFHILIWTIIIIMVQTSIFISLRWSLGLGHLCNAINI